MRFSAAENHKVSRNELGMYYSGLTLKKPLILSCTAKARRALCTPERCLRRENSISSIRHVQSFRAFRSVREYCNYSYVINTWKSRFDQSGEMLEQYPRLILVQLEFPAAVH